MPISITNYPDPQDATTPIPSAYGYTAGIGLDLSRGTGSATLNVHRTKASADGRNIPADQVRVSFGQVFTQADPDATPPITEVRAATVAEFLAKPVDPTLLAAFDREPTVGTAWALILAALDEEWTKHPKLASATEV